MADAFEWGGQPSDGSARIQPGKIVSAEVDIVIPGFQQLVVP
jgi:hypothetical protein